MLELTIVLVILIILSTLMLGLYGGTLDEAQLSATTATLASLREAIMGGGEGQPCYFADNRGLPATMEDLFRNPKTLDTTITFDPNTKLGWRGPYISNPTGKYQIGTPNATFSSAYGTSGDTAVLDGWGNPVVLQQVTVENHEVYLAGNPVPVASDATLVDGDYSRIVSAGPDGRLNVSPADAKVTSRGDDVVMFLRRADVP